MARADLPFLSATFAAICRYDSTLILLRITTPSSIGQSGECGLVTSNVGFSSSKTVCLMVAPHRLMHLPVPGLSGRIVYPQFSASEMIVVFFLEPDGMRIQSLAGRFSTTTSDNGNATTALPVRAIWGYFHWKASWVCSIPCQWTVWLEVQLVKLSPPVQL